MAKIIFDGEPIKLGWQEELDNTRISKLNDEQLDEYVTKLNHDCADINDCSKCPYTTGYEFFRCEFDLAVAILDSRDEDDG